MTTQDLEQDQDQDQTQDQDQDQDPPSQEQEQEQEQEPEQELENQENPPEPDDPQEPKTLTLEILDQENPQDPQQDQDPNPDEPEDITPLSPTTTTNTISATFRRGGGPKRKKMRRRTAAQEKKSQKKLENLLGTFKPIPFIPIKSLQFSSHETLLKRLGLWDFVQLQFDVNIRADLIAQLIANYNQATRASYVNGVRIKVNRADLARALRLPQKKPNVADNNAVAEVKKESQESIGFIEELVSNWVLLHEDTWMMPGEILNWINVIKEGHFEKVDWAGMIWFMIEKELVAAPKLGNCYYASHLQFLIKAQRDDVLEKEQVKMEIDVKDEEEEDMEEDKEDNNGGKVGAEEFHGAMESEEPNIELSLGGLDNVVKDEDEKEGKEHNVGDDDTMDFEESKVEEDHQGQWLKPGGMDGHFLRQCNLGEVEGIECEEGERKQEEETGEEREGGKEIEVEEEEEEEREEVGFSISPKGDTLEGVCSENLIGTMEAAQIPFSSGVQIRDNVSSGEFLASRIDTQMIPGGSSIFGNGNGNGNKRDIEHLENEMTHHPLNGGSKRMRSDLPWDMKSSSDFDMYMDQAQQLMGKAKMMYDAREQAFHEMSMNQQMLISEVQQRDSLIQQLQKAKFEEQQKRQVEIYKLERELYMMGNLLEGYRKALKDTNRAFAEYRAKCPLPEEPIYKDAGSGGLVLSTMELEKLRLKKEEEERLNRLLIEKKVNDFETDCIAKFEAYKDRVQLLGNKLLDVETEFSLIKERLAKQKASEMSECDPSEE